VDGQGSLTSARPTRGALVAALFAIVTIALVASYSLTADDSEQDVALDTDGGARAISAPKAPDRQTSTTAAETVTANADSGAGEVVGVDYQISLSDIGDYDVAAFDYGVLSSPPEEEAPAAPTTQVPTTAAPTTTAPPETTAPPADAESTTTVAGDDSEATETTADPDAPEEAAPAETTTTAAPANPEGFVDAGHGVFVPPVLLEIRRCESTNNYQAANPRSTARGAYQFLTGSWAGYGHAGRYGVSQAHLATNAQQDEAALITWQRDGTRPWNASRSCWS
jgi:hypothetical protein